MADASHVIEKLTGQMAALLKENAVLLVELEEVREQLAAATLAAGASSMGPEGADLAASRTGSS